MIKLELGSYIKVTGMEVKGENNIYIVDHQNPNCNNYWCTKVKLNGEKVASTYKLICIDEREFKKNPNMKVEVVTDLKKAKKEVNEYLKNITSEEIVTTFEKSVNQEVKHLDIIRFNDGLKIGTFGEKYISKNSLWLVKFREDKTIYIEELGKKGQSISNGRMFGCTLKLTNAIFEVSEVVDKIETKKGDMITTTKEEVKPIEVVETSEPIQKGSNDIELSKCDFGYCKDYKQGDNCKKCSERNKAQGYTGCVFATSKENIEIKEIEQPKVIETIETIEQIKTELTTIASTQEAPETNSIEFTVIEDTHTKTGAKIFVAKLTKKVEYSEFKNIESKIKSIGGYYSRFKKGFIFESNPTQLLNDTFNSSNNSESKEVQPIQQQEIKINEDLARRSKQNMSFDDYKEGSATQEYNRVIEEVAKEIEEAKIKVSADSQIKLDNLLIWYKRAYANWTNKHNANGANHVSQMISGASNYNMNKHNKFVSREGKLWEEYNELKNISDKINTIVSSDKIIKSNDPNALEKLKDKLQKAEEEHKSYKDYNIKARKENKKTLASYVLQNSNARIKAIKDRIKRLERVAV